MVPIPRPLRREWPFSVLLFALASLVPLCGCFGVSQNPSYFPWLWPTGDIIRTHAKPPGRGYFTNFDPHAVRLEVRPLESASPVQNRYLLIATVYDKNGKPRRNRRVEWMLDGVGHIVEVDESGYFPGRGYKVDNRYAVSYTDYVEHKFTRFNANANDDFVIRPGQTWCVITSAVEGDTHVTVYAPEIANWESCQKVVTTHWVDAQWQLPGPAVVRAGTEHDLVTAVFKHTDRRPLAGYRVRYRILDGPPAAFLPERTPEVFATSGLDGNAVARLVQAAPAVGTNRVAVEVIRPPDPTAPSGSGIVIGRGEVSVQWQAPVITLNKASPTEVIVGQDVPYTITLTNSGAVEARALTVRDFMPETLQYLRSQPAATVDGNQLVWTLAGLGPGQSQTLEVFFRTTRTGTVINRASVVTDDGISDEKSVSTQVTAPQLKLSLAGPREATVGVPFSYQLTASNPGSGAAQNVLLRAEFDKALEHESRTNKVEMTLGTLAAGESKNVTLTLTPRQTGQLRTVVAVEAAGGLRDQAEQVVTAREARLGLNLSGPRWRYAERPAVWTLQVANDGEVPLADVVVRDQLPPELGFSSATDGGQLENGTVVWRVGKLEPRERREMKLTTQCLTLTGRALNVAVASSEAGLQARSEAAIEVRGLPAFRMDVKDTEDGIEVGGRTTYQIDVTNQGTLTGRNVSVAAEVPEQLKVLNVRGPAPHRIEGQQVQFQPLASLAPKQTVSYAIDVQALKPGDVRFRARLRSDTLGEPGVLAEESTNIVEAGNGTRLTPVAPPG